MINRLSTAVFLTGPTGPVINDVDNRVDPLGTFPIQNMIIQTVMSPGGDPPPPGGNLPPQGRNLQPQGRDLPPRGRNLPPQGRNLPPQGRNLPPQGRNLPLPETNHLEEIRDSELVLVDEEGPKNTCFGTSTMVWLL
ncbi:hypothetical protein EB796_017496 [Bugula neritina]|uniref:Uncharacterized protein n=1 Tax=Bugula neritina TaxID=10212 RepID=A0A7J7JF23_BUGNE|nr:hypothetical protein EB796_017496 [Bugula neritina]